MHLYFIHHGIEKASKDQGDQGKDDQEPDNVIIKLATHTSEQTDALQRVTSSHMRAGTNSRSQLEDNVVLINEKLRRERTMGYLVKVSTT